MSSIHFQNGTIIPASWLNDVNDAVYTQIPAVIAKQSQWVSVKDFGAVGDGVTDDTVAIQNALNVASSQPLVLLFPTTSAYYNITSSLLIKSNTTILGYGATVKTTSASVFNMLWALGTTGAYLSNVSIFGLTVIGNGSSTNVNGSGIGGTYCNNLRIRDCTVENVWGQGLFLGGGGTNCWIENNAVYGVFGDGVHIGDQTSGQTLQYVYINNNYVYNSFDDGIAVTNGAHNIYVTNNTVDTTVGGAGLDFSGGYNITAEGNTVVGYAQIGVRVQYFGQEAYNVQILNNIIGAPPANQAAINLYGPNNTTVSTHQAYPITIRGNIVQGVNAVGSEAVFVTGANNVKIEQNYFSGTTAGVVLSGLPATATVGPVQNCDINNNTFSGFTYAIGLSSGNNDFKTFDNRFEFVTNYLQTPYLTYAQQATTWEADYKQECVFFKAVSFTTTGTSQTEIDPSIEFPVYAGQRIQFFYYASDAGVAASGDSIYDVYDVTNSIVLLTTTLPNGSTAGWQSVGPTLAAANGTVTVRFGRTAAGGSTTIKSAYLLIG